LPEPKNEEGWTDRTFTIELAARSLRQTSSVHSFTSLSASSVELSAPMSTQPLPL
jgi:hypothetical protein